MKNVFLFRVDGGKVWGVSSGHINRCLLVARALPDDCNPVFLMKNYPEGVNFVKSKGIMLETIELGDDQDETVINLCEEYKPNKIIVDLFVDPYRFLYEYARKNKISTIVFDVSGKHFSVPDILINDSLVKEFTAYPHLDLGTRKYIGPDYFIMGNAPRVIPIDDQVKEIMVTIGGSDPAGITMKVIQVLTRGRALPYKVNVVLGPFFTEYKEICNLIGDNRGFIIHYNPKNFLELLSRQDIVITSAGRTLYESAYLGRPVVIVPSIEHEAKVAEEYAARTGAFNIGMFNDFASSDKIIDALAIYLRESGLRRSVFKSSRALVDGRGLERVMDIVNF